MKALTIRNGYTTTRLTRLQCATLSQACWFASQEGLDPDLDHWRTMAALFHCCVAAAGSAPGPLFPPTLLPAELSYITSENEAILLQLSARQCASLAKACWFAGQNSADPEADHWLSLAGLFQACAIAGAEQWQLGVGEGE